MAGVARTFEISPRMREVAACTLVSLVIVGACRRMEEDDETILLEEPAEDTVAAAPYWDLEEQLSLEDLERGRLDPSWREAPSIDSLLVALRESLRVRDTLRVPSERIDLPTELGRAPRPPDSLDLAIRLPVQGDAPGRSVLAIQILLDRSPFSPGVIDGRWGKNTEKAVFWLQRSNGLDPTGAVDSTTFAWLYELAGRPDSLLVSHVLTPEDVAGPFVDLPENVYARARLDCLCYESLAEKLGERFHATPDLLAELNRDVELDSLAAGDSLIVPAVDEELMAEIAVRPGVPLDTTGASSDTGRAVARGGMGARGGPAGTRADSIAEIVISDRGRYLHALDPSGRIVMHFPTTLGSRYQPSPTGRFAVRSITRNPWFHYQPELLEGVPDTDRPTRLPPGPNSPVGVVWIDLTAEHYGIHGTAEPAAIGYTTSSGCVRLTNWDALLLAERIQPGTPVRFRDVSGEPETEIVARDSP